MTDPITTTPTATRTAAPTTTPTAPDRPFTDEEFSARLARVQDSMSDHELSALVVVDPANIYYLTGYNAWSFYMPQCLVVPDRGLPHLFGRPMDMNGTIHTTDVSKDRVHAYPETFVHRADVHPFEWIADRARELGLLRDTPDSRVAVETDAHFFSPRGYLALQSRLTRATLVDSRELVNWVRLVKSPAEIETMRIAGAVTARAMTAAIEALRPGRRQCDVVADIQSAQATGTHEHGGDYPAIVPMLPTGSSAGTPHLTWNDAEFARGEATTIELSGCHRRYHAPLARTVSLGAPPAALVRCAGAAGEGLEAALDVMRPGVPTRAVHAAAMSVLARYELGKDSRIGYSIGIGFPPDWGEHTASLRAEDETVLEAGMAFHVLLGMWMDGWGYEVSDSVVVGAGGAERLVDIPRELVVTS